MFKHLFVYRLKVMLRSKQMVFWTLVFPIALSIFFKLSLGNLSNLGTFSAINLAVVEAETPSDLVGVIEAMSIGDDRMFNTQKMSLEGAKGALKEGEVAGIIIASQPPELLVVQSGIQQSILKIFLDQYNQTTGAVGRILSENPMAIETVASDLSVRLSHTREKPVTTGKMNIVLTYFYSLMAMTSFYGSFFGLEEVFYIQANLTPHAARVNVAPTHKLKAFLYSSSASLLIQFTEMLLFLAFLVYVLGVDFGPKIGLIMVTMFVGSLTGITFGAFVGAVVKGTENAKTGILIGATMIGSFLSGMMFGDMKYLIQTRFPLLSWINPVNLLADAFYSLYYFDTYSRYLQNLVGLLAFAVVFSLLTYNVLRRQKYASL